jgi:hypothetical protein
MLWLTQPVQSPRSKVQSQISVNQRESAVEGSWSWEFPLVLFACLAIASERRRVHPGGHGNVFSVFCAFSAVKNLIREIRAIRGHSNAESGVQNAECQRSRHDA